MKYGRRRPWVRALRAKHRAWREYNARHSDEERIAIECGLDAFSRYRESLEWQVIGVVGHWFTAWIALWKRIGRPYTTLATIDFIHKRRYQDRQIVAAATGRPVTFFDMVSTQPSQPAIAAWPTRFAIGWDEP